MQKKSLEDEIRREEGLGEILDYAKKKERFKDTNWAHCSYSQLAYTLMRRGKRALAKFCRNRAGVYKPDNKDDVALGYTLTEELDEDE